MKAFWEWLYRCRPTVKVGIAVTAAAAAIAVAAASIGTVIYISRRRSSAAPTVVTTVASTAPSAVATTTLPAAETTAPATTAVRTTVTSKAARKTAPTTTRRTVAPPPIVVEPDNVKDDTAKVPDTSLTKPAPTPDTANGVTLKYLREEFEGAKHIIGIDVSRHQGEIDWKRVKAAGIEFAMLRCGYRTTEGGKIYEDANFQKNITGALEAGVKVGIYFFSAAINETEALEEAAFVIEVLKPYKERISYPIAYDFEILGQDRAKDLTATAMTDNAIAYMDAVADAGYVPMLYASRNALWNNWETGRLGAYRIWLAQYVNLLNQKRYNGAHDMWQCASDGRVDGISGDVDLNIAYTDLSHTVAPYLPTTDPDNFQKDFSGFSFTAVCEEVEATANVNMRISPYTDRPNKWASAKKGDRLIRTGIDPQKGWSRVEYRGVTLYISSSYLKYIRATQTTAATTTLASTTSATLSTETTAVTQQPTAPQATTLH